MKPTERIVRGWGLVLLTVVLVLFGSCKYELIDEPTLNYNEKKNAADYSDFILPPQKVTASHGLSRIVELEWEKVSNAVQYHIYSAATPYDTFTKVSETKGDETQISIDEESGITKYYCVCAVNFYGTISSKSIVACGSTLSVPVITEIVSAQEGNSVTVNWWMDNCNQNTYEKIISYNISVYANESSNIKLQALTAPGSARAIGVDGLNSTTEYYFTVEAVHSNNKSKEISTRTSAQTAHRVIPEPPADLTVTQGESTSEIKLTWKLPEQVWYRTSEGSSGFELRPLYFKVYRKPSSAPDSEFKPLDIVITPATYKAGEEATLTDPDSATLINGVQYDYYVKSFTGGEIPQGKEISAQTSETPITKGWKQGVPEFYINSKYENPEDDENTFSRITFDVKINFENFGKSYKYVVVQSGASFNDVVFTPDIQVFNTKESLVSYVYEFNTPQTQGGYYYYTLYICPDDADENNYTSKAYQSVQASGKYIVTHEANKIPKINNFKVNDGYKDKFVLEWVYNPEYVYIIHWKDETDGTEQTMSIPSSYFGNAANGSTVSYNHEAPSGINRIYSLEASTGLSAIVKPNNSQTDVISKTLGIPSPHIDSFDHDKITVKWDAVQMAGSTYTVSAKYEGETNELINSTVELSDDQNEITFEWNTPAGYDDATKAGKNIKLTVTAQSETRAANYTESTIDVCTLGPALADTRVADTIDFSSITVSWKKIRGADAYKIIRLCNSTNKTDTYYYDGTGLYINDNNVDIKRANVTINGNTITLHDINCEPDDETDSYEINQSRISWGDSYTYFVEPVKNKNDNPEYTSGVNTLTKAGSTYGFGHNVMAQKADSSSEQTLVWTNPNSIQGNPPVVYYRDLSNSSNTWKRLVKTIPSGSTSVTFKPESPYAAYEYLIAYNRTSNELYPNTHIPLSFINDASEGLAAKEQRSEYVYADNNAVEHANKGYLLAVKMYTPKKDDINEDCSSEISWDPWDYTERAIGPDKAELYIKNYNYKNEWIKVAEIDKNMYFTSSETLENTKVKKDNNVTLNLKPESFMNGTKANPVTKGPLMVLRDAKIYYSLILTKGNITGQIGEDDSVYGYRNITPKELVKCALLNMAYGFYLDGEGDEELTKVNDKLEYKGDKSINRGNGYATFGSSSLLSALIWDSEVGKYKADVSMKDFAPPMLTPGGNTACAVKITMSSVNIRTKGLSDPYLDKFRTEGFTVTVTKIDDDMPDSYSGTLKMTCTGGSNLKIEMNSSTIVNVSTTDERRVYLPMQIYDDGHCWLKDKTYGWWN